MKWDAQHAVVFEHLHVSMKVIQPTKWIAKGDRNWGTWMLSWQLQSGLEAFQKRIKPRCSAGQGWSSRQRQRLGWLNQGLVRHNVESGAVVKEDASRSMSSIFHPRHFQMGCGISRSLEPVELERDGWQSYCLCSAWGSDWSWVGRQECSRLAWSCCVCLGGGSNTWSPTMKNLTSVPWCCLLCEIIPCVMSSPGFVQYVHCMQMNMVKPMSNRLTFEQS